MKDYRLRVQGEMVDLELMDKCERCSEVVDSEAAMLAVIRALRERMDRLEERIKELENLAKQYEFPPYRSIPLTYPVPNTGDEFPFPWTITCYSANGTNETTSTVAKLDTHAPCSLTRDDVRSIIADELNRVRT